MSPKSPPFIFLIFCKRTNVKKSQRVPFFRIFGTMRLFKILFFFKNFLDSFIFFQKFLMSPKSPPFIFLIFCKRTNVKKSQRVPFFRVFGTMRLQNSKFFQKFFRLPYFFQKLFNVPKASSFQFFDILQQNECYKMLKGPFFTFFGTMRLSGNFKKIRKNSENFFSIFSFKRPFFKRPIFFLCDFF